MRMEDKIGRNDIHLSLSIEKAGTTEAPACIHEVHASTFHQILCTPRQEERCFFLLQGLIQHG